VAEWACAEEACVAVCCVTYPKERERDLHELETVYQSCVDIGNVVRAPFVRSGVWSIPETVDLKTSLRCPDESENGREGATDDQGDVVVLVHSQKHGDARVSCTFLDCFGFFIWMF